MYDIIKEVPDTKKEIEIRGRYLMMACDIEYCMLNIIMFCNPDPNTHERAGQFKEMKMAAKINNVICDMKKYHLTYYNLFKDAFDGLEEFRIVRNDMSHCKGDFPNSPDLSIFRIVFVEKDENNIERIMYKEYTEQYIEESINRFGIINGKLSALWMRLKKEYDAVNPFVHPSTLTN